MLNISVRPLANRNNSMPYSTPLNVAKTKLSTRDCPERPAQEPVRQAGASSSIHHGRFISQVLGSSVSAAVIHPSVANATP